MALTKYKQKRKFDHTPEPQGTKKSSGKVLHFVVHKHQASRLHYDFRLEHRGVLLSWAVPKGPSLNPSDKRLAMQVEDHPFEYRTFEGVIPEGNYGAGSVMIWDQGNYLAMGALDAAESEKLIARGMRKGHITFILNGKKLRGEFALVRLPRGGENSWLLLKAEDQYASRQDILQKDRSAQSERSMQQIAAQADKTWQSNRGKKTKMPHNVQPMLAQLVVQPFDDPDWIFEIKWDGFRAVAEIDRGKVEMYSRNLQPFNEEFPEIAKSLRKIKGQMVLDGEVAVLDKKGRSNFQLLQNYRQGGGGKLVYYVFDILYLDGRDLTSLPLIERKEILKSALPSLPNVLYSDHVTAKGRVFFAAAKKQNLEGIIAKKKDSPYRAGKRSGEWLKIKTHQRQEAVICGFTEPRGGRKSFGALVLGLYEKGRLQYIGHTGGGFNEQTLAQVYRALQPLISKKSPFAEKIKTNAPATWVKPKLVAEIEFSGWTADRKMRQPIFVGLRDDKNPKDVRRETPEKKRK